MPMSDTEFHLRALGWKPAPADPFVVAVHDGTVLFRTSTITDDLHPVWNHTATVKLDPNKGDLHFIVFDDDKDEEWLFFSKEDDYIGKCSLPVKTCTEEVVLTG